MSGAARMAFAVGVVGLLASGAGWIWAPNVFPHAWLSALMCYLACSLGSLGLLLIHALTGGRWGELIRGQLIALTAPLPLFLPLLVPVLLCAHRLYPWMDADVAAHLPNALYLSPAFFYVRTGVYAAVWLALTLGVRAAMRLKEPRRHLSRIAPLGLILLAFTVTFAWIDYTLSLEPTFSSSVYGWLSGSEALLLALSVSLIGRTWRNPNDTAPLARLLLGLTLLWAYLDFMQLLIVWNSDLPAEAAWYQRRLTGAWGGVAAAVALAHFALPFLLLLFAPLQRSARALTTVAVLLVLAELPRIWWLVIPAAARAPSWVDGAAMLGVLGVTAGIALRAFPGDEGGGAVRV